MFLAACLMAMVLAFSGCDLRKVCTTCNGTGKIDADPVTQVVTGFWHGFTLGMMPVVDEVKCSTCNGAGKVPR